MRALVLLLTLALVCGGCTGWARKLVLSNYEDLAPLMGPPEETGLLLIDCDMVEKDYKLLWFDETEAIGLEHCSIVKEGSEDQPIPAYVQRGHFFFPNLEPGRYCIKTIHGKRSRPDDKDDKDDDSAIGTGTEEYRYRYEFPLWSVREVVFEVAAGAPTYFGKIDSSMKYEKSAWESFLWLYPESVWTETVKKHVEVLPSK
jgi:hypothetical protein